MDLNNIITQVSKPDERSSTSFQESQECNNNNSSSLVIQSSGDTCNESLDSKNASKAHLLSDENKNASTSRLSKDEVLKYHKDTHDESENLHDVVVVPRESKSSRKSASSFLRCFVCCSRRGSKSATSRKKSELTGSGSRLHSDHGIPRRHSGVSRESMEDCIDPSEPDPCITISGSDGGVYVDEAGIHLESGHYRGQEGCIPYSSRSENSLFTFRFFLPRPSYEEISLLTELSPEDKGKKCLIIDLDETLVHSSFKPVDNADFVVSVEIDSTNHQVYVLKRPYVDEFLEKVGPLYECVLFTASLGKYADPVVDLLDKCSVFRHRLFRESCVFHCGNYVKNLDQVGRELNQVLILDNSPASFLFHPQHAIHISSWFDDPEDTALLELIPYLTELARSSTCVPDFLHDKPAPGTASPMLHQLSIHNNYVQD